MLLQIFPPSVCTHFFIYLICRMHSLCPAVWSKHRQGIEKNVKGRLHNSLCSYQVTWRLKILLLWLSHLVSTCIISLKHIILSINLVWLFDIFQAQQLHHNFKELLDKCEELPMKEMLLKLMTNKTWRRRIIHGELLCVLICNFFIIWIVAHYIIFIIN